MSNDSLATFFDMWTQDMLTWGFGLIAHRFVEGAGGQG